MRVSHPHYVVLCSFEWILISIYLDIYLSQRAEMKDENSDDDSDFSEEVGGGVKTHDIIC